MTAPHQRTRRPAFDGANLEDPPYESAVRLDAAAPALFLSDLHFGDGSPSDLFAGQDDRLIELLESRRSEVGAIVFLGDICDMPQAWSVRRIAAAHRRLFAYLESLCARHQVIFVSGNHDWTVDYPALFPGSICREAVRIGERILAWHGHQVDLLMSPGRRDATAKTYVHSLLERLCGSRLVPPLEVHDSPANRAAMAVAVSWSRLSLVRARALRRLGRVDRAAAIEEQVRYLARSVSGDPADLFGATRRAVFGGDVDAVICGHTHLPGIARTERGVYVNTGTWTCGLRTCALWTGERFRVIDLDAGRDLGDERYRSIPDDTSPADLFAWWSAARQLTPGSAPADRGATRSWR